MLSGLVSAVSRDLVTAVLPDPHAPVPVVEHDRLAVLQPDLVVLALGLLAQQVERAVVEDVAVLIDLDERRALVLGGAAEDLGQCWRSLSIVRATKVASTPRASAIGLKGWSTDPNGVDFVTLPSSDVGEYWPFVSP